MTMRQSWISTFDIQEDIYNVYLSKYEIHGGCCLIFVGPYITYTYYGTVMLCVQGVAFRNLPDGLEVFGACHLHRSKSAIQLVDKTTPDEWLHVRKPTVTTIAAKLGAGIENAVEVPAGIRVKRRHLRGWSDGTMIVPGRTATVGTLDGLSPLIRWSFMAHSGTKNTFGIVTDEFDVHADGYINKTERGWGLFQGDGKLGHKGPAKIEYAEKFGTDSLVDGQFVIFIQI